VACAASLLRWIYSMVVHDTSWDPAIAAIAAGSRHVLRDQPEAEVPRGFRTVRPLGWMSGKVK